MDIIRLPTAEICAAALLPTLTEALSAETEPTTTTPGRPRRLLHLKQGLVIRREKSPTAGR